MSGLKAAYFFDGNVNDSSSSGWNLAFNVGTYTANRDGEANRAYSFNGQSERLTISHTAISQTFSVAFWFKTSVTLANAGAAGSGSQTGWYGNYVLFPLYYTGTMDDLLVFNRALNAAEVLSLYMAE